MTLRRTLLTIIGFSAFCYLMLFKPDEALLDVGASIKFPVAEGNMAFPPFLIAGPVFIMALFTEDDESLQTT